jgi:hypothetical protein
MNNWKYEKYESPKNGFGEYFTTHNYILENEEGKITFWTNEENYFFILKFQPFLNEFKSERNSKYGIDDTIRVKFGENKPIKYVVSTLFRKEGDEIKFNNEVQISESFDFVKNMLSNDKFIIEYNNNQYITFESHGFLDNDNPVLDVYREKHLPKSTQKKSSVVGIIGTIFIFGFWVILGLWVWSLIK